VFDTSHPGFLIPVVIAGVLLLVVLALAVLLCWCWSEQRRRRRLAARQAPWPRKQDAGPPPSRGGAAMRADVPPAAAAPPPPRPLNSSAGADQDRWGSESSSEAPAADRLPDRYNPMIYSPSQRLVPQGARAPAPAAATTLRGGGVPAQPSGERAGGGGSDGLDQTLHRSGVAGGGKPVRRQNSIRLV
jgi:hypothetical protein